LLSDFAKNVSIQDASIFSLNELRIYCKENKEYFFSSFTNAYSKKITIMTGEKEVLQAQIKQYLIELQTALLE